MTTQDEFAECVATWAVGMTNGDLNAAIQLLSGYKSFSADGGLHVSAQDVRDALHKRQGTA